MTDEKKVEMAFDILENAEVVQEFDDSVWIKVDIDQWETFHNLANELHLEEQPTDIVEDATMFLSWFK